MLSFQLGTKLILDNGVDQYEYLVSSVNTNQTFIETNHSSKTIHNKNLISRSIVNEKGAVFIDFSLYLTTEHAKELASWFGFTEDSPGQFQVPRTISNETLTRTLYIVTNNSIYKVPICIGETLSFTISQKSALAVDVTATGNDLEEVESVPAAVGTKYTQTQQDFYYGDVLVTGFSRIISVTCELTKSIKWLSQKTLHKVTSGTIYKPSNFIVEDCSVSGSISQLKIDDSNEYTPDTNITISYTNSPFTIVLDSCNTTDRWSMGSVHQKVTDYKLLPNSTNSYITF